MVSVVVAAAAAPAGIELALVGAKLTDLPLVGRDSASAVTLTNCHLAVKPRTSTIFDNPSPFAGERRLKWAIATELEV